jgi:hypothetical protein
MSKRVVQYTEAEKAMIEKVTGFNSREQFLFAKEDGYFQKDFPPTDENLDLHDSICQKLRDEFL